MVLLGGGTHGMLHFITWDYTYGDSAMYRSITLLVVSACAFAAIAGDTIHTDIAVAGATPGGIATAIIAARLGHTVALVEHQRHVGGMSASGLGKSDITTYGAIQGIFREFIERVYAYYTSTYGADSPQVAACREGYYYEPSVAEMIFNAMLADEPNITLHTHHRLEEVARQGHRVVAMRARDLGSDTVKEFRAKVFIDATYEGDLAAWAGVDYRLGREGRDIYNEAHAGIIYLDHTTRGFRPGSTGLGDDRLTAYTFRLCLSTDPENQVRVEKPADYDRSRYLGYFEDLRLGRLDTAVKALSIAPIPNNKTDVNMKPWPLGFPFAAENATYVEGDWEERERVIEKLRNITLGLVYFLQNDEEVPAADRELANTYGLAKDEFMDNGHFPWQLYIREARRIVGEYTLTEHDLTLAPESDRAPIHADAIATGEFPIDSFPTRKWEPGHNELEGYILMLGHITKPYQIPYRCIVPEKVEGLLVPVALSASHVAFSSVRMEPTWMTIGQAAGIAAHLSITNGSKLRDVDVRTMQRMLLDQGQILTHFDDVTREDAAYTAMQFLGTLGFFDSYNARPRDPITRGEAANWFAKVVEAAGRGVDARAMFDSHWSDIGPDDALSGPLTMLAAFDIVEAPAGATAFAPEKPLQAQEFEQWLKRAAATVGGPVPAGWRYEPASTALQRGEVCRALYALLVP